MNIIAAINAYKESKLKSDDSTPDSSLMWFRPISYRNRGLAFCIDEHNRTTLVPTKSGGESYMTPNSSHLTEDWELVPMETVVNEI